MIRDTARNVSTIETSSNHPDDPAGAQEPRHPWEAVAQGWRELYYRLLGERDALQRQIREHEEREEQDGGA